MKDVLFYNTSESHYNGCFQFVDMFSADMVSLNRVSDRFGMTKRFYSKTPLQKLHFYGRIQIFIKPRWL